MSVDFEPSQQRWILVVSWVTYMMWVAFFWAGLAGVGLVCIASTALLRRHLCWQIQRIHIVAEELTGLWQLGGWLCIHTDDRNIWICRHELPAGRWAHLLAYLIREVPRQAVGLRISS